MILDELKKYAHDCISGKIISGRKHIWACERLLRDIDRIGQPDFHTSGMKTRRRTL